MMLYGEKNMENKGEIELCKIKFERGNLLGKSKKKGQMYAKRGYI
jgi:hypothetical protein